MQYVVQIGNYAWLSEFNGATVLTTSGAHASRLELVVAQAKAQDFRNHAELVLANSSVTPMYAKLAPTLPVTVVPASELDERLVKYRTTGDRGGAKIPTVQPCDKAAAAPKAPGVTRQIYEWVLDHPTATKADVQAAFPGANPSTVSVQFGAARKALRG